MLCQELESLLKNPHFRSRYPVNGSILNPRKDGGNVRSAEPSITLIQSKVVGILIALTLRNL